jgi:hypothetical protein
MDERRWERLGAAYGVAFAVLLLASLFVAPVPPHIDDSVGKITSYFADNRVRVLTSQMLGGLAVIPFLLFVGHLRHVMDRSERGTEAMAPVVLLSGAVVAAIALVGLLPPTLLGLMAGQGATAEAGLVRALFDSFYVCGGLIGMVGALYLGAAGYAMVKGELVEPWLGYVGLAFAIVFAAVGISSFYLGSYSAFWLATGFVAVAGFALFNLAAGVMMLMHPEQERAAQRVPILSTSQA